MVATTQREYVAVDPEALVAPSKLRRISWGAVIGGVVMAVIIQVTMNILGLAVGAGAVDPTGPQPAVGPAFGTGMVIWVAASSLLGLFAGGFIAAHLAGAPNTTDGLIHGLLTWAVATLITFFMLSSAATNIFNGVTSALGQGVALLGSSVSEVAPEVADALNLEETVVSTIRDEVGSLPTEEDASISAELPIAVVTLIRQDSQSEAAAETRQTVVTLLTEETTLTQAEAEAQVEEWEARAQQVAARADEAAEQAAADIADALAKTAGVLFMILVVGAFAAGAGGYVGTPEAVETVDVETN